MTQITQDQSLRRWDSLPLNLREALYFEPNTEFLWKTCEDEHIPEEKIYTVSQIAGFVLMGFLHPEDVARELRERLTLDQKTSSAIEVALNKRIFAPLRADIDKVYAPISKLEAAAAPKIIQDIGPASSVPPQAPMATQKFTAPLTVSVKPTQGVPPTPPPAPSPSLTDKGWSKISPNDPVIQFAPSKTNPPTPKTVTSFTPPVPPAGAPRPSMAASNPGGEFARFNNAPSVPKPPSPAASAVPAGPAPMMLHEDPQIKSIQGGSDFHISMPARDANMLGDSKSTTPSRPAVIEFGKSVASTPPTKVVHYTEFKPSMSVPPQASSAGRNVMEIIGVPATQAAQRPAGFTSIPVPITPIIPPPPQVPKPPTPPTTPVKVINKDY